MAAAPKEKPYVHQHFPKFIYNRTAGGKLLGKIVNTPEEHEAHTKKGWVESPADLPPLPDAVSEDATAEDVAAVLDENESLKKRLADLEAQIVKSKGKATKE